MVNNNTIGLGSHVKDHLLVLYAEGELPVDAVLPVQSHLSQCKSCRVKLQEIQAGVANYREFHQAVYSERIFPPPNGWQEFEARLAATPMEEDGRDQAQPSLLSMASRERSPGLRRLLPLGFAGALTATLAVLFFLGLSKKPGISIGDILAIAQNVQIRNLNSVRHPVVYEKVRIQGISYGSTHSQSIVLKAWSDMGDLRTCESTEGWSELTVDNEQPRASGGCAEASKQKPADIAKHHTAQPHLLRELSKVYRDNHFREGLPISLYNFSRWSNSSPNRKETVKELSLGGNTKAYQITSETEGQTRAHELRALQIVVRARDWHAIRENLIVADKTAEQTYEIAELDYKILPFNKTNPSLWGIVSDVPRSPLANPESVRSLPKPVTDGDLLVEALYRLDSIDALTNDQIKIESENNILRIRGTVPNNARKTAILAALGSLLNLRNIQVNIQSATDLSGSPTVADTEPIQAQNVRIPIGNVVAPPRLQHFFAAKKHLSGSSLNTAIQEFVMTAFDRSYKAQTNASAVKLLVEAIPQDTRNRLSTADIEQWHTLVAHHAEVVEQQSAFLQNELAPIALPQSHNLPHPAIAPSDALRSQAEHLYALSSANDKTLWDVLAASNGKAGTTASLSDLLLSLNVEEHLAHQISERMQVSPLQK